MSFTFENEFSVAASAEHVWSIMTSPAIAVPCMPGAVVTELILESGFKGHVNLRVGPVQLQFKGEGAFKDLDFSKKTGHLYVKGSDTKGRGTFLVDMDFVMTQQDSKTFVKVSTALKLSGLVAQYGRGIGIVKEVTLQLTNQFANNISEQVQSHYAQVDKANMPVQNDVLVQAPQHPSKPESSKEIVTPSINLLSLLFSVITEKLKKIFRITTYRKK